ncbi:twin-arginine translocase subunit TatC [Syntrophotalea carbinolica]|nr:twin-arginine translocase subunit TatC [Syntrophotalea carbinolica]
MKANSVLLPPMVDASLIDHLDELRRRLMIAGGAWLLGALICYAFSQQLFQAVSAPLRQALPEGSSLVFIHATEPFFTYIKLSAMAGLLLSLPVIFWQLWAFVAPGLYPSEKRLALPFVLASSGCFGAGAWFGFGYVFPLVFRFLVSYGTEVGNISAMLSMGAYLSLSCRLLLAFGLVFELPILIFFLTRMGIVDHFWLARRRRTALLLAFVVGAVLTPPDIVSQLAIAGPFVVLYEVSIVVARVGAKRSRDAFSEENSAE